MIDIVDPAVLVRRGRWPDSESRTEACASQEESEDIAHRNLCRSSQGKSSSDTADLNHDIGMTGDELERMGDKETELKVAVKSLEEEIDTSRTSLAEWLSMRPTVVEKGGALLLSSARREASSQWSPERLLPE